MQIGIISLFPEMFEYLKYGITGRTIERKIISTQFWNPRDFTQDKHQTIDDRPYGGGPGMLMKVQPIQDAIQKAKMSLNEPAKVVFVSPQGKRFDQQAAIEFASRKAIIFLAGRYEGIDERLLKSGIDEEWSIGDYVISGGELAIMLMIDTIARLLPGALGDDDSARKDSFYNGLLDYPHYTRPKIINGVNVPEVLLSGDHTAIDRWRTKQALGRTWLRRPDLLEKKQLTDTQRELLNEFIKDLSEDKS